MKRTLQMFALLIAVSIASWAVLENTSEANALSGGVTFGAFAKPINGQSNITAFENLERQLGTDLQLVRAFSQWDDNLGADHSLHRWVKNNDKDLVVSVKAQRENGDVVSWRSIANANPGSRIYGEMQDLADGARRHGDPITVVFHHEPEAGPNTKFGDSDDFVAAFRKVVEVFEDENADNVQFGWVMTNWSFTLNEINPSDRRAADKWYPGDDAVDFIGADPYNWTECRDGAPEWRSLEDNIQSLMTFSDQHPDKPLILAEFGSDDDGRKGEFIDGARELLKQGKYRDRFAAVMWFHSDGTAHGHPDCTWWIDSSQNSLNAGRRLAQDSFFQVPLVQTRGQSLSSQPVNPPTTTTPPQAPPATAAPRTTTTTAAPRTTTTTAPPPTTTTAAPRTTTTTAAPRTTTTTAPPPTTTTAPPPQAPKAAGPVAAKDGEVLCDGREVTIMGTNGPDVIVGTNGRDVIHGLGGADIIHGLDGDDVICGGAGKDTIRAGAGADVVLGNRGKDKLHGDDGPDKVFGGKGKDRINGRQGADQLEGGIGDDRILGGINTDGLLGGSGTDTCDGGRGIDDRVTCETTRVR